MIQYRYILDTSSKKFICPKCGHRRFVRMIDTVEGGYIGSEYGRCDRQDTCGYFKYPAQPKKFDNDFDIIKGSEARPSAEYVQNTNFVKGLNRLFDPEKVASVIEKYGIGGTKDGRVIFWQFDIYGNIRTGKIMDYDPVTLKRKDHWSWAHNKYQNFKLDQVFYGMHLIKGQDPDFAKILIVESEKTAILCDLIKTDWTEIYLAAGGREMINQKRLQLLMGFKDICLIPDIGCAEYWAKKVPGRVKIWQWEQDEDWREKYPPEVFREGNDIGDLIFYHLNNKK
jgi:hypothetical protein